VRDAVIGRPWSRRYYFGALSFSFTLTALPSKSRKMSICLESYSMRKLVRHKKLEGRRTNKSSQKRKEKRPFLAISGFQSN